MLIHAADVRWLPIRETIAAFYSDRPWPDGLAELDLTWHRQACAADPHERMPGRPTLMARWNWTDHKVRQLIASRPPADRQPTASAATLQPDESSGNRQPVASPSPVGDTPPRSDQIPVFQGSRDQIDLIPAPVVPLFPMPAPTTAEGIEFLRIIRRWSEPPTKPEHRWRVRYDEDLGWFLRDVMADAPGLDVLGVLRRWDLYLEGEHRQKESSKKSTFPKPGAWKGSLNRALGFAKEDLARRTGGGSRARPEPTARRGSFGGRPQTFDVPVLSAGSDGEIDGWDSHE